jgi:signal transduction histidine kinase
MSNDNITSPIKIILDIVLISPFVLAILFDRSILSFDINTCEVINSSWITLYKFIIEAFVVYRIILITKSYVNRKDVLMVSISFIVFLTLFSLTELISSLSGIYEINLYSLFLLPVLLIIIIFSVIDFNTFDLKADSQKMVIYTLVLLTIIQMFLIKKENYLLDTLNIIMYLSLGKLLIKSAKNEAAHSLQISKLLDKVNILNSSLNQKVTEQTVEIQQAYQLEKKSRRELEKLVEAKDNFINIIQHNLRVPITRIANELSKLPSSRNVTDNSDVTSQINHLRRVADDLKDISKIKLGSQILNLSASSVLPLVTEVIRELDIDIKKSNISISFPADTSYWPELRIDQNKIREVMFVVIENAIRYNIQNGTISISTRSKSDYFIMEIKNTGIGISRGDINNLFDRTFYRSSKAKEINPTGMGIGLYVSRSVVEAHHGSLDINSGEDGLVTVRISIPHDFLKPPNKQPGLAI